MSTSGPSSTTHHESNENPIVPGFVYIENFLTPEENQRIFDIIDSHQWSKEIIRRQQFYGPVFYFTPQSLSSTLQPVSTGVRGVRFGDDHIANHNDNNTKNPSTEPLKPTTIEEGGNTPTDPNQEDKSLATSASPQQQTDLYAHNINPLNWLIQKLIDHGLFERADVRDPFAEYDLDYSHHELERDDLNEENNSTQPDDNDKSTQPNKSLAPRLKRVPPPQNSIQLDQGVNSDPRSPDELAKASSKLSTLDSTRENELEQWGDQEFYPDQILVNEYRENMGIGSHFDDALSFGPQIIGISLGQACTLILSRPLCCQMADNELRMRGLGVDYHDNHHKPCSKEEKESCTKSCSGCVRDSSPGDSTSIVGCNHSDDKNNTNNRCQLTDIEDCQQPPRISTKTSHYVSLRDYSRPDWKVGNGPSILGKYCRCTRQQYLTKHFPNAKYLLNTPLLGADYLLAKESERIGKLNTIVGGVDDLDVNNTEDKSVNQGENLELNGSNEESQEEKQKPSSSLLSVTAPYDHPPTRLWKNRAMSIEEELTKYHKLPIEVQPYKINNDDDDENDNNGDGKLRNYPQPPPPHTVPLPPQTQDDLYHFLLQYDYGSLPHRKFHQRSGEDITTPEKWKEIDEKLRAETEQTLDFTPSLEQFNRCTFPSDKFEYRIKPGSVYVMSGVARYQFRHAIPKGSCVLDNDGKNEQNLDENNNDEKTNTDNTLFEGDNNNKNTVEPGDYRRVSLTIRSLLPGRRQVEHNSTKDQTQMKRKVFGKLSETIGTTK